ncbi:imidazole glycerol phosphate synthase subunit HisH [Metabacillus idriensis]|uniref:imidazole glycerol phosphate synthase subunit HisH n=1 Tax=Metabacillus idriensis TaxID=324768 RepID=UPI001749A7D1|nr:imidazole glycerol phosphate synthase subunit HisH [Metabacillus idriensis]
MIGIIDYGMGNLYSVSKALERLNIGYFISENPEELENAEGYILPGVGSFKDAMAILNETKLKDFIQKIASEGKPLLGICLGMQLLFQSSEENGLTEGLSLLEGTVVHFPEELMKKEQLKVPHMGWNRLKMNVQNDLLEGLEEGYSYFVHSYYVKAEKDHTVLASADYGVEVPAVVGEKNIFGTQFHPEKSSHLGIGILRNFVNIVEEKVKS